jgi:predicted HTH transcriptional regulator
MEERLQKALEFANYRQTLNNQLQKLKIRSEGMLIFAKNGGSFTINRELICFLDYLNTAGMKEAALLDDNNTPVLITDIPEFLKDVTKRYFEVTTDYLKEYQEIRKSRSVRSILDLKDE